MKQAGNPKKREKDEQLQTINVSLEVLANVFTMG